MLSAEIEHVQICSDKGKIFDKIDCSVVFSTKCILTRGLRGGNSPQVTKCINEEVALGRENYPFSLKKAVNVNSLFMEEN